MRFFQLFAIFSTISWKIDSKAVNQKYDLILLQESKRHYIPLIDGQPIIIPEHFAEPSETLRKKHSGFLKTETSQKSNDNSGILIVDEVFPVNLKQKTKQETEKLSNKHKKICKINKPESKNIPKVDLNRKNKIIASSARNVFNENLLKQDEGNNMFGPNFKSFVFNPLASSEFKFQECKTSKTETGVCRYVQHCFLPTIVSSLQQFMNNVCIIENRYIGVCCPHFPIQSVSVKWQNQTFDDQIKTPQECGIGTNTRIVGGSDANIKAWPWMVALMNNKKFFCGGALINNRYVLTAAHCTFGVKKIIARLGEFDLNNAHGEDYRVVEIKRHGQYNRFTLRNDIALLKLEKAVTFNEFIKTVCFPDQTKNYTGKIATLSGWGRLQEGITSNILQEVEFPVIENEECARTHGLPIPESLICTSALTNDKSACNGDSGGPLMLLDNENRWKVIGIVSWGRRGCNTNFPSVFTRVTYYMDWIKQHAI